MEGCTLYTVSFRLGGDSAILYRNVQIWDDYTTTDDIPQILAVTYYGLTRMHDQITVLSVTKV